MRIYITFAKTERSNILFDEIAEEDRLSLGISDG